MGWDWDNDEKDDDEVKDEMKKKIDESENGWKVECLWLKG